jgi:putative tricarboxylic transport membrane protein
MNLITGERLVAACVGVFGTVWLLQSRQLSYWSEYAPGSGFLPFWLGVVLVVLSIAFLVTSFAQPASAPPAAVADDAGKRRVVPIVIGLFLCILALDWIGFAAAIAGYLFFLIHFVERRSMAESAGVAIGTSFALWLIFRHWLSVPLPVGPWGF